MVGKTRGALIDTHILFAALLGSTALTVSPARAQQAAGAEAQPDIVVTATRRSESLQKVPISIQALGQATLEQQHVASFDDYAKLLPSVSFQSFGPGQSQVYFRGISSGGDGLDVGSLPATGLYLDETPVTTIGGSVDIHVYDMARIEALAGPQGTLFGASSLSGTLRLITNKPDPKKFEAGFDIQANKFGKGGTGGTAEGFVNIPLSPDVAIRLVGFYEHDGGYIDNTLGTRTYTLGDNDPSTNLTVSNASQVKKNFNTVDTFGGRAALRAQISPDWTITPSIIYQHQNAKGTFLYDPRVGDLEVHDFSPDDNLDRWYQAALTVEGKIGTWDLVYSGGYFERRVNNQTDYSYYSVVYDGYQGDNYTNFPNGKGGYLDPTQIQLISNRYTKHTQEVRISSPATDRMRVTAGLFYQRQTDTIYDTYDVAGLGAVPQGDLPNLVAIPGFGDAVYLKSLERVDRDYAAFAEGNFDITPKLTLTAGIRGFLARNSLYGFSGFDSAIGPGCVPASQANMPCINVNGEVKESGQTHKVSLAWKIDPEKMIYATYSTGFRPGGLNRDPAYGPYSPDTISNYEVGWKTRWGAFRFNGAVFYEKWDNMQFGLARPGDNGVTSISNVGGAETKGVEGDVVWRRHGLELSASGTYLDAKITTPFCESDSSGSVTCTPAGTRLPVQPKLKGSATARYAFKAGGLDSFVQGAVHHQSGTRSFLLDSDADVVGYTGAFTTFDFSAGTTIRSGMTIEAFIDNAFDSRGQLSRNSACAPSICGMYYRVYPTKPQLFGIKFGQKF